MTPEYMREVLEHMSIAQLIDTILINPTVHLAPSYRDTGLSATYTFKPLSNLVYTRDQQVGRRAPPLPACRTIFPCLAALAMLICNLATVTTGRSCRTSVRGMSNTWCQSQESQQWVYPALV